MPKTYNTEAEIEQISDVDAAPAVIPTPPAPAMEPMDTEGLNRAILASTMNRYDLVCLVRRWAYELNKENPALSVQKLIETAVNDVLSSKVSAKMIQELPKMMPKKIKPLSSGSVSDAVANAERSEKRSK